MQFHNNYAGKYELSSRLELLAYFSVQMKHFICFTSNQSFNEEVISRNFKQIKHAIFESLILMEISTSNFSLVIIEVISIILF